MDKSFPFGRNERVSHPRLLDLQKIRGNDESSKSMVKDGIDPKLCQAGSKLILLRVFQRKGRERWSLRREGIDNLEETHRIYTVWMAEVSLVTMYREIIRWGSFFKGCFECEESGSWRFQRYIIRYKSHKRL